jgi:acetamidase/formamidase
MPNKNRQKGSTKENSKTSRQSVFPSLDALRRRGFLKKAGGAAGAAAVVGSGTAQAQSDEDDPNGDESEENEDGASEDDGADEVDYEIEPTPENIEWGIFDPAREPILTIESGDTVKFGCVLTSPDEEDHTQFLLDNGIAESDIFEPEVAVGNQLEPQGPHPVTGPVYVEDAEPGDVLEVTVQDVEVSAPYGVNYGGPGGHLPDTDFSDGKTTVIPFDEERETALFTDPPNVSLDQAIEFPLEPFMGIYAVSQNPSTGPLSTGAPSYFGGNMDNQRLGIGTSIYLPVNAQGALFWTGDGHAAQGDGEVSLTAIETSLSPTLEFTLHKDIEMDWPVAETDEFYVPMGFSEDLDDAMTHAVREAISMLVYQEGLEPIDAYRLCSLNVDFNIAEVVDGMEIIDATIPKSMFSEGGGDIDPSALRTYQF